MSDTSISSFFPFSLGKNRLERWGRRVMLSAEWWLKCTELWQEIRQSSGASHLVLYLCACPICWRAHRGEEWMFIFNLTRPLIEFHTLSLQPNWWVNWVGKLLGVWKIGLTTSSRGGDKCYNIQLGGDVSQKYRHQCCSVFLLMMWWLNVAHSQQVHGQQGATVGQVHLIFWRSGPTEGPWQAGEMNGQEGDVMKSIKSKCEMLHLWWNNPCSRTSWKWDRKWLWRHSNLSFLDHTILFTAWNIKKIF